MRRRQFLATAGLAMLGTMGAARAAGTLRNIAEIVPAGGVIADPSLLVAGGAESEAGKWGGVLSDALARGLGQPAPLPRHLTSGQDGVTGANLFDTQTVPDGTTALLVPGAALTAALAGDPRAHFDFGRWVPLMMSLLSPVVVGRVELHRTLRDLVRDRPVRVAVSAANSGIALATLLAMNVFGLRPVPVPGFGSRNDALAALADGRVDVVQLSDPMPPRDQAALFDALAGGGAVPLFTLSDAVPVAAGGHAVPTMAARFAQERGRAPSGLLYEAWKVVAAAASLDVALVLPMLTPPAQVAGWRHAVSMAQESGAVAALTAGNGRKLVAGPDCGPRLRDMTGEISAVLTLRRWLAVHTPEWRLG
ncbi:hypothetical protein AAC691_03405 [Nguyenibacter vanlangensis]|uniref:Tripartite-type tricarboxylate transporter, receptor component TctC n=2 Tax=Nguyenibacter vanlangensis TaxID=1216886 RepID=A0ABZ3D766_9PROT